MNAEPAGPHERPRGPVGFRKGERVEARVIRPLAGRLALVEVEGVKLVAWLERDVVEGDWLYLEVVAGGPSPRFRRLTGGAVYWSLPVGSLSRSLNREA
jgi:hypothetical protein